MHLLAVLTLSFGSCFFFFQAEDGIRDKLVTGVQTCALPICRRRHPGARRVTGDRNARPAAARHVPLDPAATRSRAEGGMADPAASDSDGLHARPVRGAPPDEPLLLGIPGGDRVALLWTEQRHSHGAGPVLCGLRPV